MSRTARPISDGLIVGIGENCKGILVKHRENLSPLCGREEKARKVDRR